MTVEVVAERDFGVRLRRDAAALLAREWGPEWRPNGYAGHHPPSFRTIALDERGRIAGHISAFPIPTTPSVALLGLGDLVVAPRHRGCGIAWRVCELAVAVSRERAEVLLVDTVAAASTFRRLGFQPVRGFSFFYETDLACVRHQHWLAWSAASLPPRVQLLAHGDF